jgi:hypothetical protein
MKKKMDSKKEEMKAAKAPKAKTKLKMKKK